MRRLRFWSQAGRAEPRIGSRVGEPTGAAKVGSAMAHFTTDHDTIRKCPEKKHGQAHQDRQNQNRRVLPWQKKSARAEPGGGLDSGVRPE